MVVFGQSGCIQAKWFYFEQKWLYAGKSSCIHAEVFVIGQSGCNRAKLVVCGQGGFFFRQKLFYSGKSDCTRLKWLY